MKTIAEKTVAEIHHNHMHVTPSQTRARLNALATERKEKGMAYFWKMGDGSVVKENADGLFDVTPGIAVPTIRSTRCLSNRSR